MAPPRTRRTDVLSHSLGIADVERILIAFADLIESEGWKIRSGSELEQWLLFPDEWQRGPRGRSQADLVQQRRDIRGALGLCEMARHLFHAKSLPVYDVLRPHLRLFVEATAPAQNLKSERDEAANKLFELLMALLLLRAGATEIALENPHAKPGRTSNPDVLFQWRGRRGAVACKVLDSKDGRAFVRNFEKGLRQIQASPAEFGCVFFNLKNLIPEDLLLRVGANEHGEAGVAPFASLDDAQREVKRWIDSYLDEVRECLTPELWHRFDDARLEPEVEFYFADTCIVQHGAGFRINTVNFVSTVPLGIREVSSSFTELIDAINDAQGQP